MLKLCLERAVPLMGSAGEVLARIKGGRNCLCPSKEFLAESNRDTKASEIHLRGNPGLYFL